MQTTTQISLGAAVEPVSRYGAEQFEMIIIITKVINLVNSVLIQVLFIHKFKLELVTYKRIKENDQLCC